MGGLGYGYVIFNIICTFYIKLIEHYNLLFDFNTLAEDTDFFNFPRPLLILFPTVEENLCFSEGFSFDMVPDAGFLGLVSAEDGTP